MVFIPDEIAIGGGVPTGFPRSLIRVRAGNSCRALRPDRDLGSVGEIPVTPRAADGRPAPTPNPPATMNPTAHALLLAALASPALAQSDSDPRSERPMPAASSEKIDYVPSIPTQAAPRALPLGQATTAAAPTKTQGADRDRVRPSARPLDRLYYTVQQDGTTWVSGRTYKAAFGAGGATYVPFLGSRAPRNFPLEISLASASVDGVELPLAPATTAVRDGDRVVIDRGPVDEVYELGLDSVEQTFVVAERPAGGDLRFVVRLETEMTRSEEPDCFTYRNELGSVHYGRAFVREPDGRRVPVASRLVAGGVEITVGREYLANASFPLVVDPVITTFAVDSTGEDSWVSEVSYDLTTDRYLTVYEFNFSQTDGDINAVLREGDGSNSYFAYLDNTSENWRSPKCANLNKANQFLMVAQATGVSGLPDWNIWGMTIDAATFVAGWKTLISTTDQTGAKYVPDVGGDSYDGPGNSYYCVTWRRDFSITDWDVHARLVRSDSTLVGTGTVMIDNSGSSRDTSASISKCAGALGQNAAWTIVWHREVTNANYDVYAARLSWDGNLVNASTPVTTDSGYEYFPRVSSPAADGRTLLVYGKDYGDDDLLYALLNGTTVEASGSLTALDAPATLFQDQRDCSVDTDGYRFVVAYAELYSTSQTDYDIWISSFAPFNGSLVATESHRALDFSGWQSLRTDVVAHRTGGAINSNRFYASWDTYAGTNHDVDGGIYDRPVGGGYEPFCFGDGSGLACPCDNSGGYQRGCANSQDASGAGLAAAGDAQSTGGDTMSFTVTGVPANVTCTLFQGTSNSGGTLFGDGIRCVSGTQIRIRTKFATGTSATWPSGAEADVSVTGLVPFGGGRRYYQVSYRNSAVYCTAATFNVSNGLDVLWLP